MKMTTKGWLAASVLAVVGGTAAWAQTVPVEKPVVAVPSNVLSVGEIESRLTAQGIRVKEIKVRDLLAKVEGFDAQGREVEVVVDRRSGELLSHKFAE